MAAASSGFGRTRLPFQIGHVFNKVSRRFRPACTISLVLLFFGLYFILSRRKRRGPEPSSCLRTCLLILIEEKQVVGAFPLFLQFFVVPPDSRLVEQLLAELNSGKCHGEIWNWEADDWQTLADWDANLWLLRCGILRLGRRKPISVTSIVCIATKLCV